MKKLRYFSLFIILWFFYTNVYAQSLNDYFSPRELEILTRVQALIHNTHFREAESLLVGSKDEMSSPSFLFFMQANYFWRYVYTKNDSFLVLAKSYGEQNLKLLDRKQRGQSLKDAFFSGAAHGYLGLSEAMSNHLVSAFKHGKKGYDELKKIYRQYPDFRETELGLGIYEGMVAKLPRVLRWVAAPLGIKGDMDSALEHLSHAAGNNMITKADAWFYAYGFLQKNNPERSEAVLDSLVTNYSDNPLYLSLKGLSCFRSGEYRTALQYFTRSKNKLTESFQDLDLLAESYMARCEFKLKNYRKCIDEYLALEERFKQKRKSSPELDFLYAYVSKSYQALGDSKKAQKFFNLVKNKKIYDRVKEEMGK